MHEMFVCALENIAFFCISQNNMELFFVNQELFTQMCHSKMNINAIVQFRTSKIAHLPSECQHASAEALKVKRLVGNPSKGLAWAPSNDQNTPATFQNIGCSEQIRDPK